MSGEMVPGGPATNPEDSVAGPRQTNPEDSVAGPRQTNPEARPIPGERLAGLLRGIRGGGRRALGEFYDLTGAHVFAVAVGLVGETVEAERLLTATYIRLWKTASVHPAEGGRKLKWLVGLMVQCHANGY